MRPCRPTCAALTAYCVCSNAAPGLEKKRYRAKRKAEAMRHLADGSTGDVMLSPAGDDGALQAPTTAAADMSSTMQNFRYMRVG